MKVVRYVTTGAVVFVHLGKGVFRGREEEGHLFINKLTLSLRYFALIRIDHDPLGDYREGFLEALLHLH